MKRFFVGLGLAVLVLAIAFASTLFLTGDLVITEDFLNLPRVSENINSQVKTPEQIYQEADYAVIVIAPTGTTPYFGSGVIVRLPDYGLCVLTAQHVLNHPGLSAIKVLFRYQEFEQPMELIGYSEKYDAALLKFQNPEFTPKSVSVIGRSSILKPGSKIVTIGSSVFGRFWIATGNLFTKPGPLPSYLNGYQDKWAIKSPIVIMADLVTIQGFSGGPVLNEAGELIGIIKGFVMPSDGAFSNGTITLIAPIDDVLRDKFVKP